MTTGGTSAIPPPHAPGITTPPRRRRAQPAATLLWQAMNERMRDSAFATNIHHDWTGAVAGYYGGPNAFNVWSPGDWKQFANNKKLPIWVAGLDGAGEGRRSEEHTSELQSHS